MSTQYFKASLFCVAVCLCIKVAAAQAFTPKVIEVPLLGFTGYAVPAGNSFTAKVIEVPLLGFTGYTVSVGNSFAPKVIEVPLLGFTGYTVPAGNSFSPKVIEVPLLGFTGHGATVGSYGQAGLQAPVNTGLAGGSPVNRGQLESLGTAKPDLLVLPQLNIANSPARWGSTVVLYTHQVQSAGNGLCSADITYTVQNSGTAAATEFASVLLNRATTSRPLPHQWAGIAQGITQSRTERLILRPGRNDLTLHLDQSGQLVEMNRGNNQARLLIILNGSCQP